MHLSESEKVGNCGILSNIYCFWETLCIFVLTYQVHIPLMPYCLPWMSHQLPLAGSSLAVSQFPASLPSPSPSPQLWQYQDCQFLALSVTNLCRHELVWHYQWAIYAVMNWCYSISELFMPLWNIVTVSVTNLCRHGLVWPYQSPIYAAMK